MLGLIAQGIGFGFTAGTSPGPFQSYLVNVTLNQGWRRSIWIVFAPLISDGPIILVMAFLLKDLPPEARRLIQIAGGLFVLWIAWGAWRGFRTQAQAAPLAAGQSGGEKRGRGLRGEVAQGVMINFLSPGPYIFWGSVTGPLLIQGLEQSALHGAAFLLAFYGTLLSILAAWVIVFDRVRRLDARVTRAIVLFTILLLVALGGSLIVQGIS